VEARGFRDRFDEFVAKDTVILGVSLDSAKSHRSFRAKEAIPFDLLVDPELELSRLYDVKVKNLIVFKLIDRVTYVIGKDGRIREAFEQVTPSTHAADILCRI
jgi:thioredoxin-dependent peroxiredoxin